MVQIEEKTAKGKQILFVSFARHILRINFSFWTKKDTSGNIAGKKLHIFIFIHTVVPWRPSTHTNIISPVRIENPDCSTPYRDVGTMQMYLYVFICIMLFPFGSNEKTVRIQHLTQGCRVSGKCQEKTKFSPGQGKVREFWKKCQEFWPFHSCQGIIREFCDVMVGNCLGILSWHYFFYGNFHHMIRDLPGLCLCQMSAWQI